MRMFNAIVTAIDFSEMSRDVLHYAARLAAGAPGAHLHIVHVVPDPLQQPWAVEAAAIDFTKIRDAWVSEADRRLEALILAEGLPSASFTPVVRVGRAADTIVTYAAGLPADLIVLGTHGYGPVKHFFLGSVAERVLRRAACPVLTVPHSSLPALASKARATVAAQS